jgi:hypothetical protein
MLAIVLDLIVWASNIMRVVGIKESDTGLSPPSQWDLVADKQMMQSEQPLQVRRQKMREIYIQSESKREGERWLICMCYRANSLSRAGHLLVLVFAQPCLYYRLLLSDKASDLLGGTTRTQYLRCS